MIRCDGCAHPIDPDCCQCGDAITPTGQHADNHIAVPMGCTCHHVYDAERTDTSALEALRQFRLWRGEMLRELTERDEAIARLKAIDELLAPVVIAAFAWRQLHRETRGEGYGNLGTGPGSPYTLMKVIDSIGDTRDITDWEATPDPVADIRRFLDMMHKEQGS